MPNYSRWLIATTLLLSLVAPYQASAQGRPRVVVLPVEGPQASKVQAYIEDALRAQVDLVGAGGASTPQDSAGFAQLAEQLDAQAIVTAEIIKNRNFDATVTVRQGRDGATVGEHTWSEKKAPKLSAIERELWGELGRAIQTAEGPAPEPTQAEPEESAWQSETDEDSDSSNGARRPALIADLGFGPFWRDQAYSETTRNVPYRYFNEIGSPALWLSLSVGFYPLALLQDGMLGNIGLVTGFGLSPTVGSATEDGTSVPTSASTFQIGVRGRLPLDRSEVGVTMAFGMRNFSTDAPAATPIPNVSHTFLRLAADGHLTLTDTIGLEGNLGYLLRLGSGEVGEAAYFPELSGGGIELGLAGVYAIGDTGLSALVALDWQRFYFTLNPDKQDPNARVAGGAVDNYYTFTLGARYALTTGGSQAPVSEDAPFND